MPNNFANNLGRSVGRLASPKRGGVGGWGFVLFLVIAAAIVLTVLGVKGIIKINPGPNDCTLLARQYGCQCSTNTDCAAGLTCRSGMCST